VLRGPLIAALRRGRRTKGVPEGRRVPGSPAERVPHRQWRTDAERAYPVGPL